MFSFGFGCFGELANGESYKTKNIHTYPTPKIVTIINRAKIGKVSKIAKGMYHTLFLMSHKEDEHIKFVYGLGRSNSGALSVKQEEVLSPILVTSEALKGVRIGDIASGGCCSVLLSKNGVPYSCGNNKKGQCGVGTFELESVYSAFPMTIEEKIIQIDCGDSYTVLLTSKRDIYKTGIVYSEQKVNIPIKLHLNEKVKLFRAGCVHLLVVGKSEQLYGMGNNTFDQLTSGILFGSKILTKIFTSLNGKIKDIKCNRYDSYALMENNDLYGWGGNEYGQSKGNGTVSDNPMPFKMKSNVEQIEVGYDSCFVFCKEGVYVCGYNESGDLGLGHTKVVIPTLTLNKNLANIIKNSSRHLVLEEYGIPKFDPYNLFFDVIIKVIG